MSRNHDFEIEEYKHLVAEIASADKSGLYLFAASIAACLTVWSLVGSLADHAISRERARYLYLALAFLNLVTFSLIVRQRVAIRRAGMYIQVFFESKDRGPHWKTRLAEFRKMDRGETWDVVPLTYWVLFVVSAVLFLSAGQITWPVTQDYTLLTTIVLLSLLSAALALVTRRFRATGGGGEVEERMRTYWKAIKSSETPGSSLSSSRLQRPTGRQRYCYGRR